jgi:mannose-6-phosphate isomerase
LVKDCFKIQGVVQHYAWGGHHFIPELLGIRNESLLPFAEYWLGAHPNHPSLLEDGSSLDEYLKKNPIPAGENNPGKTVSLPYLLKILDVQQMLSIQVHPGKKAAEHGYEKEDLAGIPITAAHRNYKDKNHKPELMVALDDFYLLHGFKPEEQMVSILTKIPELNFLLPIFQPGNYQELYEEVMYMSQQKVNEKLQPLADRILPLYKNNALKKDDENFWAARAIVEFCQNGNIDLGIFSIYLFNLVSLKRGEGIFQDHGLPHAYLEGKNVEVMANSDNVLRAGLTEKFIDIKELLKHVEFDATHPKIIKALKEDHIYYPAPVSEFELHHYLSSDNFEITAMPGEIVWVEKGRARVRAGGENFELKRGEALYTGREMKISLTPAENLSLYRVAIPRG